jgi:hypothetical protein
MLPSDLLQAAFILFVAAPVVAAILAFKGPPVLRQVARIVLLCAWLAQGAATIACLWYGFGKPSSGIGNGVLLFVAIPTALFAVVWFGLWRGARRHEYVQSLPPDLRRVEELADIEHGLEAANENLASMERRVESWGISSDERSRLRLNIATLKSAIAALEQERAKRT